MGGAANDGARRYGRARLATMVSLIAVLLSLVVAISLMIPALRSLLPPLVGVDYRVIQIGLVLVTFTFALYTFERERHFRRLTNDLVSERVEAARLGARLDFLKEVQTERDTVSALLLASADGIVVVDASRRVERVNPALQQILGYKEGEWAGKSCWEIFGCKRDGQQACGHKCPFERVFESGETLRDITFQARRQGGPDIWISGAYAQVTDLEGNRTFGIGSLRDITRAKEIEQLQHDFVSIVSHELRGPLTAIKGFVQTLLLKSDRLPPETVTEFLSTINEQADRLNQLVEDLLNVSRIETRRLSIRPAEFDLEAMTRKLLNQFSSKWGGREIVIEADLDLPLVNADEKKIDEVMVNLIDNAVKYSPAGGAVRVNMRRVEDGVEVSVEDSGIGIAPEDATKLFERFQRIASPETRDIGGTGLGLYIVKNLIEAHGGRIFVTSAPGVGSTFTFFLPGKISELQDA